MKQQAREIITTGYDAALKRIRSWILASAIVAPVGFLVWKVFVPQLPDVARHWVLYLSVTSMMLALGWFIVSLILLATYAHEKKSRLRDLN